MDMGMEPGVPLLSLSLSLSRATATATDQHAEKFLVVAGSWELGHELGALIFNSFPRTQKEKGERRPLRR